jgi:hypothetical protein
VPVAGPELEFGVAGRPQLEERVRSAIVQFNGGDRLGVAAVEVFGEAQHGGERAYHAAALLLQVAVAFVAAIGDGAPMVAGDQRDGLDLVGLEAAQIAVLDQVVRVLVVALVADVDADIVEQRRIFQPLAVPIRQAVHAARLIEQRHRQTRHLLRVLGPVVAPLAELDDAATSDVGVAIGLRDLLAVSRDVVEDQALTQRQVAERQFRSRSHRRARDRRGADRALEPSSADRARRT